MTQEYACRNPEGQGGWHPPGHITPCTWWGQLKQEGAEGCLSRSWPEPHRPCGAGLWGWHSSGTPCLSSTQLNTEGFLFSASRPFSFLLLTPLELTHAISCAPPQANLAARKPVSSSFLQCSAIIFITYARVNLRITPDTIFLRCGRQK